MRCRCACAPKDPPLDPMAERMTGRPVYHAESGIAPITGRQVTEIGPPVPRVLAGGVSSRDFPNAAERGRYPQCCTPHGDGLGRGSTEGGL